MRSLIGIVLLGAVTVLGWEKSLSERVGELVPALARKQAATPGKRAMPVAPNAPGAWMWDENRKSALDRPAYNQTSTFTNHIYYVDNYGRKYWIDGQGKRHYDE